MSAPGSIGGALPPPYLPSTDNPREKSGERPAANALSAPFTPGNRMPIIDRSKVDPSTLQAAEGMEAMFLDYMLKVMRETVPKNEMDLESPATGIYRGMMDSQFAQKAAHAGGVGLADQIIAYLESQRYTLPQGQRGSYISQVERSSALADKPGGAHEGQPDRK
jgi:hypothetical protein